MIKAVLFDYGGVMSAGGRGPEVTDRLGEILGISGDESYQYIGPYWHLYDRGKITEDAMWENIEKDAQRSIPITDRNIWNSWEQMQLIPDMVQLVHELKSRGIQVGLLSNVIPNTEDEIRRHGGYDIFDFVVLSTEAGFAKPEHEIYQIALEKFSPLLPEEIIFVDDQARFLTPAEELGMQTVLATSPMQVISDIMAALIHA